MAAEPQRPSVLCKEVLTLLQTRGTLKDFEQGTACDLYFRKITLVLVSRRYWRERAESLRAGEKKTGAVAVISGMIVWSRCWQ